VQLDHKVFRRSLHDREWLSAPLSQGVAEVIDQTHALGAGRSRVSFLRIRLIGEDPSARIGHMTKKSVLIAFLGLLLYSGLDRLGLNPLRRTVETLSNSDQVLSTAFAIHRSGFQVEGEGTVSRVLPDDNDGGRHQRFILQLGSGQTLLVAHNIDVAPRMESLHVGDRVQFNGQYEWNAQGGVIHWTHRDTAGHHLNGWLKHAGRTYQ
jgi:Protein of unknown function (DUF3465)